jgi:hypothetical protein
VSERPADAPVIRGGTVVRPARCCEPGDLLTYECDAPNICAPRGRIAVSSAAEVHRSCACHREVFSSRAGMDGPVGGAPRFRRRRHRAQPIESTLDVDIPNGHARSSRAFNPDHDARRAPGTTAPGSSSQQVCSIGGNIAENLGRALPEYGLPCITCRGGLVLPDGELITSGPPLDAPARSCRADCGSGTLGVVTRPSYAFCGGPNV